jgi:hypothetical protein
MENEKTPELIVALSKSEAMALKTEKRVSIRIIMILSKIFEGKKKKVLVVEAKDEKSLKFIGGYMKDEDQNIMVAAKRILSKKLGYFFEPKEDDIFFAGQFKSTIEKVEKHFKIFLSVARFEPGQFVPNNRKIYWESVCDIEDLLVKSQLLGLKHYKNLV